jgi:hypothetical protein
MPRAPWTAIPAARSSAAGLKIRLYAIIGVLLLAAACGIFSAIAWAGHEVPIVTGSPEPHALGLATTVANDFFNGTTLSYPDPTASGVSPALGHPARASRLPVTSITFDYFATGPNPTYIDGDFLETYYFDVTAPSGDYQLAVPMDVTSSGSTLAAYPALLPLVNAGPSYSSGPAGAYSLYSAAPAAQAVAIDYSTDTNPIGCATCTSTIPTPVSSVIAQWAADFTSNTSQAQSDLQANVVADASASPGDYVGVSGLVSVTSQNDLSIIGGTQQTITLGKNSYTDDIIHVSLVLTPLSAKGFTVSSDYDVLVLDPQTTTPHVVAWGPAGSGPTLSVYQNRL